jgi:hypothetical protein
VLRLPDESPKLIMSAGARHAYQRLGESGARTCAYGTGKSLSSALGDSCHQGARVATDAMSRPHETVLNYESQYVRSDFPKHALRLPDETESHPPTDCVRTVWKLGTWIPIRNRSATRNREARLTDVSRGLLGGLRRSGIYGFRKRSNSSSSCLLSEARTRM